VEDSQRQQPRTEIHVHPVNGVDPFSCVERRCKTLLSRCSSSGNTVVGLQSPKVSRVDIRRRELLRKLRIGSPPFGESSRRSLHLVDSGTLVLQITHSKPPTEAPSRMLAFDDQDCKKKKLWRIIKDGRGYSAHLVSATWADLDPETTEARSVGSAEPCSGQ